MKKALGILLVLVLIATVFVSCSQDAGQKVAEELVSVSFDGSKARSLTPSRDPFAPANYVWTYTAQKADTTGLTTGETTVEKRINTGKGLSGKVPGFSQGYWNFTLYAYAAVPGSEAGTFEPTGSALYSGTASHVKVAKGDENVITVSVSPATTGNGYIAFDKAHLFLNAIKTGEDINAQGDERSANFVYGIYAINDTTFSTNLLHEVDGKTVLAAGSYFVRVSYRVAGDGDDRFDIADEAIVAVVYGGQTTTIKGSIGELSTDVSFGANEVEIPSAEGTEVAVPEDLSKYEDTDEGFVDYQGEHASDPITDVELSNATPTTEASVVATVPARAVYSLLQESIPDDPNTTSNMSLDLTVDINTQETTASQMAYDVNLIKTVETTTTTSTGSSTSTNASLVKNVAEYVAATIKVGAGLRDVKVYHSGNLMKETEDISKAGTSAAPADETEAADAARDYAGFFLYDGENGILYLKTKSFSPFVVTFTPDTIPETARVMNVTRGVGYVDLQDAVDAAVAGETLRLIDDIEDLNAQVDITKSLTLDLNGKTISNTVDIWNKTTGAWSLISVRGQGAVLTITGNGILDAKENDCYALDVRDAEAGIIIENGTYVGNITAAYALIGSITVNGGSFDLKQLDSGSGEAPYRYMLNCLDANFKEGTAVITVTGGSFHMFNPAVTHGEPTDPTSYVADGYVSTYDASTAYYSVVPAVAKIGDTYFASLKDAADTAQSGDTIEILTDFTISAPCKGSYAANELRKGVTLDGNDHIISLRFSDSEQILLRYLEGSIKDLTVDFGDIEVGSIAFYAGRDDYAIEFKDVTATGSMSHFDGNCGVFVIYGCTNMTLDGCVSYVDIDGIGTGADYDGVFVGYAYAYTEARKGNRTFTFKDCINYGTVSCGHVGLLVGNMVYSYFNVVATDCYNYGTITEMNTDYTVQQHYPNIVYGATSDNPWSTKINGVSYTKAEILAGAVDDVMNKGTYGIGSSSTLTISRNEKGSFEITGFEGAAYYVVNYGLYTTLKSGGSTRSYVSEKLNAPGTTQLKAYSFVDTSWAEANPTATSAPVVYGENTYTVYTLNDVSYYLINNNDRETLNGQVRPATLISVSAYSSTGKLLAAAGIGSSSSTVQ